jgi:sec-independent protein translocase protein TatA
MFTSLLTPGHLAVVLVVVLLVFGPKRIPELGKSIGGGLRELKQSMDGSGESDPAQLPASEAQHSVASSEAEGQHKVPAGT